MRRRRTLKRFLVRNDENQSLFIVRFATYARATKIYPGDKFTVYPYARLNLSAPRQLNMPQQVGEVPTAVYHEANHVNTAERTGERTYSDARDTTGATAEEHQLTFETVSLPLPI